MGAKRTAFGSYGGKLAQKSCTDLAEHATRACLAEANAKPITIDSVIFGNVIQSNKDTAYLARHVALRVGAPVTTPALAVNRLCGSGFQSVISAVHEILAGDSQLVLAGGTENMSGAPHVVRNMRFGTRLGVDLKLEDSLWSALFDKHINQGMGQTAENIAKKFNITREQCDAYALLSHERWAKAHSAGTLVPEITPITVRGKRGQEEVVDYDECPRKTSIEQLAKLPSVFAEGGVVTAGNASAVSDGAAAVLVASEEAASKNNLKPLARIVGYKVIGCDPTIMGMAPVAAIDNLMKAVDSSKSGSDVSSYCDIVEITEAFAAQYLAVEMSLNLNRNCTNVNGGAIAMGHPVGASGSRILVHLTHQLKNGASGRRGLGAACIGGGQGIAVLLEAV